LLQKNYPADFLPYIGKKGSRLQPLGDRSLELLHSVICISS